jgi:hypothetical protein
MVARRKKQQHPSGRLCGIVSPNGASRSVLPTWQCNRPCGIVDRVSTLDPPIAPDPDDLRGLASGLRQVVDLAVRTLYDESGPSAAGRRVMAHLGCELADVIPVTERFPLWEHVNVQRGVDAYLAAHGSGEGWIGLAGGFHQPHENMLSLINSSSASRVSAARLVVEADLGEVVAGTEGVTASFIKEMIRRTVLVSLRAGERPPVLRGPHFAAVLAEMNGEHNALTRSLLGAPAVSEPDGQQPADREPVQHPRPWPVHPRG